MNFVFLGACDLKAVTIESKIESPEEWAHIEWGRTVKSVEKWLKNNNFEGISLNSLSLYVLPKNNDLILFYISFTKKKKNLGNYDFAM